MYPHSARCRGSARARSFQLDRIGHSDGIRHRLIGRTRFQHHPMVFVGRQGKEAQRAPHQPIHGIGQATVRSVVSWPLMMEKVAAGSRSVYSGQAAYSW